MDATADPTPRSATPSLSFTATTAIRCTSPLLVFDGEGRLASVRLRPGNAGNNRYATPLLTRLIRAIKARLPQAMVVVRADSGFCTPRLLDALEALDRELGDVHYAIGLEKNVRLVTQIADALTEAAATQRATHRPARVFTSLAYQAKSWRRERYVVAKAEQLGDKPNPPRFVVTTLDHVSPRLLYENGYCGRGDAENRIKDFKRALAGDRLSCTTYVANAFRLLLHAFAYRLLDALRDQLVPLAPALAKGQFDTVRLRLLKVAAHVRQSARRICVTLPRSFPARVRLPRTRRTTCRPHRCINPPRGGARSPSLPRPRIDPRCQGEPATEIWPSCRTDAAKIRPGRLPNRTRAPPPPAGAYPRAS